MSNIGFADRLDLFHRILDVETLRQSVIANNITNVDTPNFKRSEVNFESQLRKQLTASNAGRLQPTLTHSEHVAFDAAPNFKAVQPKIRLDYTTTGKNNNNNVDIEVESASLLQSRLNYLLYTNTISGMFSRVRSVLS